MSRHVVALALGLFSLSAFGADDLQVAQADSAAKFESLDKNSDGQVSLDEASTHERLFTEFKNLDGDKDGRLTKQEFAKYKS